MIRARLLLLMLEAANADLVFTISLKRSTLNLQINKLTGRLPNLNARKRNIRRSDSIAIQSPRPSEQGAIYVEGRFRAATPLTGYF